MMLFTEADISRAVSILSGGGIVVFPTETSYAIGCIATDTAAVERLFAMKLREHGRGMPIILPVSHDPARYVHWNAAARALTERYWPGALNIVADCLPDCPFSPLTTAAGTHALRKSSHPVAAQLARELDQPIVATSLNMVGETPLYSIDLTNRVFQGEIVPDAIIDVGQLPVRPPSTVIKLTRGIYEILRQGDVVVY